MPTSQEVRFVSVEFHNFKGLARFTVNLRRLNILVGPNNCGKSTVISAFRLLEVALRKARSRNAERVHGPNGQTFGHWISKEHSPVSLENVHTNYEDVDSTITFRLSNGNQLALHFPVDADGCALITRTTGRSALTAGTFRTAFPLQISVVPVLGPLEHDEPLVEPETVVAFSSTHRASRHFRNYWLHFPDGFENFAEMLARTWPGLTIRRPSRVDMLSRTLHMFCTEGRIDRELYWAGFGFQIWCQLLTHISRAADASIVIIDEPEIYLHPDVQRQLLGILRDLGPDILIATHSTEIMSEADPSDIVLVDKTRRTGQRLHDIAGIQVALEKVGSVQNITLTRLARNKRILFVEYDDKDFVVLRQFARRIGLTSLAAGTDLTAVSSGGFSSWEQVKATAWGIEKTIGSVLLLAAVYDRDYRSEEEVWHIVNDLNKHITFAWIHVRKEIENYLIVPAALQRALEAAVRDRASRVGGPLPVVDSVDAILLEITEPMKHATLGQFVYERNRFCRAADRHAAVLTAETTAWFESKWKNLETRLEVVPGKETLAALRQIVQERYSVTLTDARIINSFKENEIPSDMVALLHCLDRYRTMSRTDPEDQ